MRKDKIENQIYLIKNVHGRGSGSNESGRFNKISTQIEISNSDYLDPDDIRTLKTEFYKDTSKTIIAHSDSPDLGFTTSLNAYRGCEHGCIYCYARPGHEYFNLSAGLDFESKIFVKENAPELLRAELMKPRWTPTNVMMSGVTDCYQPIERKLQITRRCLEVFRDFKNPVSIITKNFLVTRDVDILAPMAAENLVSVTLSVTTLDEKLARTMEPRTSSPQQRLKAIQILSDAGIPVSVNVAPVVPGLTDHEIPRILEAAAQAGATSAGYVVMRLPYSVKDLFVEWLEQNYPEKKEKVVRAIRDLRDGKLYDADFETRMKGTGVKADHLASLFKIFKQKYFPKKREFSLRTDLFQRPGDQLSFGL